MEAHVPVRTRIPVELRPIEEGKTRRRAPRSAVSIEVELDRSEVHGTLCRIVDLSLYGARLQTFDEVRIGHLVRLTLPGDIERSARIVWFRDFEAGCQFEKALTELELAALTAG
jgi:hypothetical protein